jgi:polygalacturonase
MNTRRSFLLTGAAAFLAPRTAFPGIKSGVEFDVRSFGAVGDGVSVDTAAIQRAIDTASTRGGGRVLLPGGKRFLTGALVLKAGIDFHLADDAILLANPDPVDYGAFNGLINSDRAQGLKISGTGSLDGQAMKFVTTYSEIDERWEPKKFRPRMLGRDFDAFS